MDTYAPRSECCWVDVDSGSLTINQRAVRFSTAQTLERNPCTQRKIRGFLAGHGKKERFCMRTGGRTTRGTVVLVWHVRQRANGFRLRMLGCFTPPQERASKFVPASPLVTFITGAARDDRAAAMSEIGRVMRLTVRAFCLQPAPAGGIHELLNAEQSRQTRAIRGMTLILGNCWDDPRRRRSDAA